ncbi:MAG: DedA family protein [Candidatus Kapabacteria bacterium]|nr:DedA family protein [Candidatus Kapabacteria bacterium]MCS7169821.1 DedA family protein [Candidatus Kapabacteria bacterium]MDW7997341.1 YqaA family protein [Bacteroidota bacterium]MDW8225577.1 YqaA family protein [Bacteroidota bacterium]
MLRYIRQWLREKRSWMEAAAAKPGALWTLFGIAFAESSVFPIPPDAMLVPLAVLHRQKAFLAAAICTVGSILGALLGYALGYGFMDVIGWRIVQLYNAQEAWQQVVRLYRGEFGMWFLVAAAFTPIPYKIATLAAGAVALPLLPFIVLSLIGRGARFFLVAALAWAFGAMMQRWIEQYFDRFALAFVGLLVLGFVALRWLT